MSGSGRDEVSGGATAEEALRAGHAARARSAAARAAAVSRYVERGRGEGRVPEVDGVSDPADTADAAAVDKEVVWKAAHAARVSAQAVAVLAEGDPDPAADSRCARNAAASAAQAADMGRIHDGDSELAVAACEAALKAAQAAGSAAKAGELGANRTLNAAADAAESAAVAAAERAGWVRPGEEAPRVSTGVRSGELMRMLHL
ncbi:hypothetical protein [Streptomyces sp. NPDC127108]|uniref:hypothetical protein n=1 Tax=Streptomyces sp. NPDC127108 TaxID=3345361 RepID=UPI00363C22F4